MKRYAFAALSLLLVAALLAPCPGEAGTRSSWEGGFLRFYDSSNNYETVNPVGWPWRFEEEFMASTFDKTVANEDTNGIWTAIETNLNAAVALSADGVPGLLSMALDADNNAERAVIYFGDNECASIVDGVVFEARVKVSVAPTLFTTIVVGLAGADNSTADSIDTNAWFRCQASTAWLWETDDGTTDDDDNASGVSVSTSVFVVLRIDARDEDGVKFYVNGVKVGTGDMSELSSTTGKVQPYIAVEKVSGAGLGTLLVDYVRMWGVR